MFKKTLLAAIMVVSYGLLANAQTTTTKTRTPIWNDVDAFISTMAQSEYGEKSTIDALASDIADGNATVIPSGTRISVVRRDGSICFITVQGVSGFWVTYCLFCDK